MVVLGLGKTGLGRGATEVAVGKRGRGKRGEGGKGRSWKGWRGRLSENVRHWRVEKLKKIELCGAPVLKRRLLVGVSDLAEGMGGSVCCWVGTASKSTEDWNDRIDCKLGSGEGTYATLLLLPGVEIFGKKK